MDHMTGDRSTGEVALDECRALVAPGALSSTARTLCRRFGIDATIWRTTIGKGGLFQGVAVGNRTARMAFAAEQGKRIIADKTGLWSES
jgi:hypothetical protein